jgi:Tfp pilus assembly protein PilV
LGFSLVELLISLGLMMMLMLALLASFTFIARGDRSLTNYGDINAQARIMLERLGADLRSATDVTATHDVIWSYDAAT